MQTDRYFRFIPYGKAIATLATAGVTLEQALDFAAFHDLTPDDVVVMVAKGCTPQRVNDTLPGIDFAKRLMKQPGREPDGLAVLRTCAADIAPYMDLKQAYATAKRELREGATIH